jgi:hypothetical protein
MWLELGTRPVSLTVSVNESALFATSAVPETTLPFWAAIGKLTFDTAGAVEGVPPQAAMRIALTTRASRGFFTHP